MQKLIGEKSLVEETIDRIADVVPLTNIVIATTASYEARLRALLPNIPPENFIIEPISRGTTAAFAYFTELIYRRDPEAIILSLASDHAIDNVAAFHKAIRDIYAFTDTYSKSINLVGIVPSKADTGLGYIKVDQKVDDDPTIYSVEKFIEKPSLKVAEKYLESGDYFWNAAYYCYKAKVLIEAYAEADPRIMSAVRKYLNSNDLKHFEEIPLKIHEIELINAAKFPLYVLPAKFGWSDIGNWGTLHEMLAKFEDDKNMVATTKQHIDVDSANCMVMIDNKKKVVTTVGLNDIVIVDTHDALLVLNKNNTEDLKKALEVMKEKGLKDYL